MVKIVVARCMFYFTYSLLFAFLCIFPYQVVNVKGLRVRTSIYMVTSTPKSNNRTPKTKNEFCSLKGLPCTGYYTLPQGKTYVSLCLCKDILT